MSLRSNFPDSFLADQLPVLESLMFDSYESAVDYIPSVYNMRGSSRWGEQTSTMARLGPAAEKPEGEAVTFDAPIQGYDKTYTHVSYALAVNFSEELIEDDNMQLVSETYQGLGKAVYQTRQIQAWAVFNDGFADTGPDGASLFNATHTLIGGGTYGNRPATDVGMSVAGMREMEVDMIEQVDHRSLNVLLKPKCIMVPGELKHTTFEILKSQDRPDTANRAMNTFYNENYDSIVNPFLTSATAWFALAEKTDHKLIWYDRKDPATRSWYDERSGDYNTKIRTRFSNGYSDWMGTWGTTG